eukprot:GILK01003268.1.p1 GENE.GILK01003268.1~~GILK01003268.1.p1  ORF type:complete len:433 (+),score=38.73 GILK01003268.1:46-1344(+)
MLRSGQNFARPFVLLGARRTPYTYVQHTMSSANLHLSKISSFSTISPAVHDPAPPLPPQPPRRHILSSLFEFYKLKLVGQVVSTTFVGYIAGVGGAVRDIDPLAFAGTTLGTLLVACAGSAFNQIYERNSDQLMKRTADRPLANGERSLAWGVSYASLPLVAGTGLLYVEGGPLPTQVALVTWGSYMLYTVLKPHTRFNTHVGALVGGLSPLIGYAAAKGTIYDPYAALLFSTIYLWQFPHFYGLSYSLGKQYKAAGLKMLCAEDPTGMRAARGSLWAAGAGMGIPLAYMFLLHSLSPALLFLPFGIMYLSAKKFHWVASQGGNMNVMSTELYRRCQRMIGGWIALLIFVYAYHYYFETDPNAFIDDPYREVIMEDFQESMPRFKPELAKIEAKRAEGYLQFPEIYDVNKLTPEERQRILATHDPYNKATLD